MKIEAAVKSVKDAVQEARDEVARLNADILRGQQFLNTAPDKFDLTAMLDELAAADRGCVGHFNLFPYKDGEERSEEASAHWVERHRRREAALSALTRFAKALSPG